MILSDRDIVNALYYDEDGIDIQPDIDDAQIQPASIDLRLGDTIITNPQTDEREPIGEELVIEPGDFLLAPTLEAVGLPDYLVGFLTGRSSLGRRGGYVHVTAGLFDPCWPGTDVVRDAAPATMEMGNLASEPIVLEPGDRVCQMYFLKTQSASTGYSGQYGDTESVEGAGEI